MNDELRTDYKKDILLPSQNGRRTFDIVDKDGNVVYEGVSLVDKSQYLQVGDEYDSDLINAQNEIINALLSGGGIVKTTLAEYDTKKQSGEIQVGDVVIITDDEESGVPHVSSGDVSYDNTDSGLTATDVKSAIDEVNANLSAKTFGTSVNLSSTPYLTPTAGYITVVSGTGYATARIIDTNGVEVPITAVYKDVQNVISTYVKAGFYLTLAGAYGNGYAKFTPII